jgi:uncharacterized protein
MRLDLKQIMRRRPDQFLERLQQQSELVLLGTAALVQYMREPNRKNAARVRIYERKADDVRRDLIIELNQTFVTPIDREDLFALSRSIDDILDYAYATIFEVDVLDVSPNPHIQTMVSMVHVGATEIYHATTYLEQQPQRASEYVMRAKSLENHMENLYTQAVADLFQNPQDLKEVIDMIKMRELYRHLFHAMQSVDKAADNISDILMKFY